MLRLTEATLPVLREVGFVDLTLQLVAERAGVTRATAYTYFASKDHLVAEVFRRRMESLTIPVPASPDVTERVVATLRHLGMVVADEPALRQAIVGVFNSADPEIDAIRIELYRYLHQIIADVVGDDGDDETVSLLEVVWVGAMMRAVYVPGFRNVLADEVEGIVRRVMSTEPGA